MVELQERTEELQQRNEALERNVSDVLTENRHLKEPLAHANNEVAEMRAKTDDYDNMKSILQVRSIAMFFVFLVHGQVTIIFVVSVCLFVCLFACLLVQSFSQPSFIRF